MKDYKDFLKVDPIDKAGTRVTKVTKKDYGYRVQMFNNYITIFYIKLIVNENKTAKAHYLVKRNYSADQRYTLYYGVDGLSCTQKEYKLLNS